MNILGTTFVPYFLVPKSVVTVGSKLPCATSYELIHLDHGES